MLIERRKYMRYQVVDGAVAVLKAHSVIVGPIIDISMNGMGFSYMENDLKLDDGFELGIMLFSQKFHLEKLGYRTVADESLPNKLPFSPIRVRRRCLHFESLTHQQICMLTYFVRHFASAPGDAAFDPICTGNNAFRAIP